VQGLANRVRTLEAGAANALLPEAHPQTLAHPPLGAANGSPDHVPGAVPAPRIVALGGRTILALAGAYLIRALTDAGMLSPLAGVALALAYALAWYTLADRAAARDERMSASFHGLAGGLIAYPLLWETSTRLGLVAPAMALMAVVGVFAAGSAVAARHRLGFVAWVGTLLGLGTVAGLLIATHELLGVALALLVMAALVEGLAFHGLWHALRWPAALLLDGAILVLVWLAGRPEGLPPGYPAVSPAAAVAIALSVPTLYLVSIAARTLRLDRSVSAFEVLQGATALALGFGGAARLVAAHGGTGCGLAVAAVALGMLCYAVAFAFVERREGPATNFYFYSTAGGLLALLGSRSMLDTRGQALFWCALALLGSGLGRRFDRMTLRYHGAAYLGAASLATGLLGSASRNLSGDPPAGLELPSVSGFLAAATALACAGVLSGDRKAQGWRRVPQGLVVASTTWVVAGILVAALARPIDAAAQPAVVATLRTGVLAALAVVLALLARRFALVELSWLVYPILALGGFKLVTEDVPAGRAAELFLSFVLYGAALIAAPRLLRSVPK
jgi:hypothetical protein